MSVPNALTLMLQRARQQWTAFLTWWRELARPGITTQVRALADQIRLGARPHGQRLSHWWARASIAHKAIVAIAVVLLIVCACCSGSAVFSLTPFGQVMAGEAEATMTAQAAASSTQHVLRHSARTPTLYLTPVSTRQAPYPVCNEPVTNAPCVLFASIRDAAVGESYSGATVRTSLSAGVVSVQDDITTVPPSRFGPVTSVDSIQFQCYNIQQALWYGLDSTINPDGSQTFRKSAFSEVDITFVDNQKGNVHFASCRLTSAGVDRIDKAGMWDDGDYRGAWPLYDGTSYE